MKVQCTIEITEKGQLQVYTTDPRIPAWSWYLPGCDNQELKDFAGALLREHESKLQALRKLIE